MNDMLNELAELLKTDSDIASIAQSGGLKSFERSEKLAVDATSITLRPVNPPEQVGHASNTSLAKHFIYQVDIEAKDRMTTKNLQGKVEKLLEEKGFYQSSGGLDEYFSETNRYVDARVYEGNSKIYGNY